MANRLKSARKIISFSPIHVAVLVTTYTTVVAFPAATTDQSIARLYTSVATWFQRLSRKSATTQSSRRILLHSHLGMLLETSWAPPAEISLLAQRTPMSVPTAKKNAALTANTSSFVRTDTGRTCSIVGQQAATTSDPATSPTARTYLHYALLILPTKSSLAMLSPLQ